MQSLHLCVMSLVASISILTQHRGPTLRQAKKGLSNSIDDMKPEIHSIILDLRMFFQVALGQTLTMLTHGRLCLVT